MDIHAILEDLEHQEKPDAARLRQLAEQVGDSAAPEVYERIAALWERAAEPRKALDFLSRALAAGGDSVGLHRKIAGLYRDFGELERAVRHLTRVVELLPEEARSYTELAGLFEEAGQFDRAAEVYEKAYEVLSDPRFRHLAQMVSGMQDDSAPPVSQREEWPIPPDEVIARFRTLFSGREGVYARQWVSPSGEAGYSPVREPLTPSVIKSHLLGNRTVGVYQVRIDDTVKFLTFDVDVPRRMVDEFASTPQIWLDHMRILHTHAWRIASVLKEAGLASVMEDSGFKGRHVWVLFRDPVPASLARAMGVRVLELAGPPPRGVHVEVFPKQGHVPAGGLGNLIKLPLGIHLKTGRRSLFLETAPERRVIDRQFDYVLRLPTVTRQQAQESMAALAATKPDPSVPAAGAVSGSAVGSPFLFLGPGSDSAPAPVALPTIDRELKIILRHCPLLRALTDRVESYHTITGDERVSLMHTLGYLTNGPAIVNYYLSRAGITDADLLMKSRFRGNPASCSKLRKRLKHLLAEVECSCEFGEIKGYPTPLLHLTIHEGEDAPSDVLIPSDVSAAAEEYIRISRRMEELGQVLDDLTAVLKSRLGDKPVRLETPEGVLEYDGSAFSVSDLADGKDGTSKEDGTDS